MDHQFSEHKLILLYIIREKEIIKVSDLSDFVMFRGYMDYFSMQNYISELCDAALIAETVIDGMQGYQLLSQGKEVVELFRTRIPHSIREDIREYATNSYLKGSPLLEVDATIEQKAEERFEVKCVARDYDKVLLSFIKITSDEETANQVRNEWLQKGMTVYWNLLKEIG